MIDIITAAAKYLIILLFAVFTFISFGAQREGSGGKKRGVFGAQRALVFLVHALAFLCVFINAATGNAGDVTAMSAAILYGVQLLYLIFIMCVVPRIVSGISRAMNNVMCMLITVGFIIQTRLSFETGRKHLLITCAATIIYIVAILLCGRIKSLYRMTWAYYIAGLALLMVVYVFARVSSGAKISIDLGFISIQPFEFVKILFVFFAAAAFNKASSFKTVLITALCAAAYILILVMCNELGTSLILAAAYVMILFVATKKFLYLLVCVLGFAAACVLAYMLFSHVRVRVDVWLNPWVDVDDTGYQITQSLFAIGTGGWLGSGLYEGSPGYVPMVANDFVFSAVSEELGAVFSIFMILLCLCFALMIFRVAIRVSSPFYKLTAFGLGAVYAFQVFLEIGGAIKFIPSTGINLPFISSGGSSLVASMIIVAAVQGLYVISESDARAAKEAAEWGVLPSGDSQGGDAGPLQGPHGEGAQGGDAPLQGPHGEGAQGGDAPLPGPYGGGIGGTPLSGPYGEGRAAGRGAANNRVTVEEFPAAAAGGKAAGRGTANNRVTVEEFPAAAAGGRATGRGAANNRVTVEEFPAAAAGGKAAGRGAANDLAYNAPGDGVEDLYYDDFDEGDGDYVEELFYEDFEERPPNGFKVRSERDESDDILEIVNVKIGKKVRKTTGEISAFRKGKISQVNERDINMF